MGLGNLALLTLKHTMERELKMQDKSTVIKKDIEKAIMDGFKFESCKLSVDKDTTKLELRMSDKPKSIAVVSLNTHNFLEIIFPLFRYFVYMKEYEENVAEAAEKIMASSTYIYTSHGEMED